MTEYSVPAGNLKRKLFALKNNKFFEIFVLSIIVFSALMIGLRTYDIPEYYMDIVFFLDWGITFFFLFEIIVRFFAEERYRDFVKNGWNIFDTIIVTVSLIPIDESEMVLLARLVRIFRVLRLISLIPELRMLINALLKSLPAMGHVLLLMFIIFYIYAAVGSFIFEPINDKLWGDIAISMLTLFRVVTFEGWTEVMYETMEVYPIAWLYYLSFIFINAFVFLNMMIGIVIDRMQTEHEVYNLENDQGETAEIHHTHDNTVEILKRLEQIEQKLNASKADKTDDR